jgi:hypothetical protein
MSAITRNGARDATIPYTLLVTGLVACAASVVLCAIPPTFATAPALVTSFNGTDRTVAVRYEVDQKPYTANLWFGKDVAVGSWVTIEYDKTFPTRARHRHINRHLAAMLLAFFAMFMTLCGYAILN